MRTDVNAGNDHDYYHEVVSPPLNKPIRSTLNAYQPIIESIDGQILISHLCLNTML